MTTKEHDEQKALQNVRHPRWTLHTSIPKAPSTLRHPGHHSEPGSSCSVECFTSGRYSKCGGLLDTGSEAGMTEKAVMRTPAQQRRPSHHELARHPGRDSEPGSSCSVACFTSGR
ncbi:hypothetical protein IMCC21906_00127 [Spongiibacter sp. IMCC21906]|nr:hypothetical protein IMCC21906_00127 [Spongiibacter sp. IMCC21906]